MNCLPHLLVLWFIIDHTYLFITIPWYWYSQLFLSIICPVPTYTLNYWYSYRIATLPFNKTFRCSRTITDNCNRYRRSTIKLFKFELPGQFYLRNRADRTFPMVRLWKLDSLLNWNISIVNCLALAGLPRPIIKLLPTQCSVKLHVWWRCQLSFLTRILQLNGRAHN